MKKLLSIILSICIFLSVTAGLGVSAYAYTHTEDDFSITIGDYSEDEQSTASFEYTGEAICPEITVKDSYGNVVDNSNYTVSYSSNIGVGKAKVQVSYSEKSIDLTFNILPPSTAISSLTSGNKSFTVKWKKFETQVTGYQLQYSTNSKFNEGVKSITVSNYHTTSKTVKNLAENQEYYVRIRTYKTVDATKYYSSWSSAKSVITKSSGGESEDPENPDDEYPEHTFIETYVAPTCTDAGYKRYTCSDCGYYYDEVYAPATGHIPETVFGKSATCTESGLTNGSRCKVCGTTLAYQQNVVPTGHNWDEGKVIKEATAAYAGSKLYTCRNCGDTVTEDIPKYNATTANPIKVTAVKKVPTVKASTLKKKDRTIALKKVARIQKAKGPVTFEKASGSSKIKIDSKTGKITLKKGLKKGTYKVKMKVKDAGTKKYKASTKTVTFKINVK